MHGLSIQKFWHVPAGTYKIPAFVAGIICLALSLAAGADPVPSTLDQMSLKQKVGQVFIWTYAGTDLTSVSQTNLEKYQPGALIVFSRNIQSTEQIAKMNAATQTFASKKLKAPFFLMIDQEGGVVTRLHTAVPLPSALALGKMDDTKFISEFGKANAELLRSVGFNVNLAPVLDISDPAKASFIGNRTFGADPDKVASLAVAYAEGISDGGMIPTAKHFPGHGGVVQDSHQTMPKKLATAEELEDKDLVPFAEYAGADFPRAVMMAHLALPNIDSSGLPSTYSHVLIQDYLRGKLKYNGLIVTDDLEMNGASLEKDIGERAVRAFLAGNDMLMLAGSPKHQHQAYDAMLKALTTGRITEARLKESLNRILAYKQELKLSEFKYDEKVTKAAIAKMDGLSKEVLKKNFQLSMSSKPATWPAINADTKALVLSSDKRFFESFNPSYRGQTTFYQLTPSSLEKASAQASDFSVLVFYASGSQTAHWLAHLPAEVKAKTIVVNANNPGEVEAQNTFLSVLNINSNNPECGASLGEAMSTVEVRTPAAESKPATSELKDEPN